MLLNGLNCPAALHSGFKLVRLAVTGVLLLTMAALPRDWTHLASAQAVRLEPMAQAQTVQRPIPALQPPVAGYVFPARQTLTFTVDWRCLPGDGGLPSGAAGRPVACDGYGGHGGRGEYAVSGSGPVSIGDGHQDGMFGGFWKQVQEGRRKVSSDLTFDYNAGKQTQVERNLVKGTQKQQTTSIPACVTDSLSGIFYAASQRLTVGQDFGFPLADAMRTVTVTMKVEAREEIKTPAGTFQTIRVQPTAEEGVVKNRGNIWIWYTDDARHMPVQIRARLFWGTITFHLQSVETK